MPTLNIGGKKVKVDDSFLQLSPEEQQATVEQIAAQLGDDAGKPAAPERVGTIADAAGQGLFGLGDEAAGVLGASANSIANLFGGGTGDSFGDAYTQIRDIARQRHAGYEQLNPEAALAAELGASLLTGGAGAARAGALKAGASLGRTAGVGAAEGAAYGFGASEADTAGGLLADTATGAALGGATGAVVPAVTKQIGGLLSRKADDVAQAAAPATGAPAGVAADVAEDAVGDVAEDAATGLLGEVTEETIEQGSRYADDVRLLKDAGVDMTTGQQTGNRAVRSLETTSDAMTAGPLDAVGLGGAVTKTHERQRQQLQTKLMEMAGFPDDVAKAGLITDDALEAAGEKLSREYTEALSGKTVNLGDDFIDTLAEVEVKHSRLVTPQQRRDLRVLVGDFLDEAAGEPLTGARYQELRSFAGKRARELKMSNPQVANLFGDLQAALDDAFVASTGTSNKALNTKYAQFMQLKKAAQGGGTAVARGELPLATLNRNAKKSPGSKEWKKLLNAASAVLGDTTPNSGTTTRLMSMLNATGRGANMVTGGVPGLLMNQALARGVGGSAPQMARQATSGLLGGAGAAVQRGGQAAGVLAPAVGAPLGLLSQPPLPEL